MLAEHECIGGKVSDAIKLDGRELQVAPVATAPNEASDTDSSELGAESIVAGEKLGRQAFGSRCSGRAQGGGLCVDFLFCRHDRLLERGDSRLERNGPRLLAGNVLFQGFLLLEEGELLVLELVFLPAELRHLSLDRLQVAPGHAAGTIQPILEGLTTSREGRDLALQFGLVLGKGLAASGGLVDARP